MKAQRLSIIFCFFSCLFAGCDKKEGVIEDLNYDLVNTYWNLTAYSDTNGVRTEVEKNSSGLSNYGINFMVIEQQNVLVITEWGNPLRNEVDYSLMDNMELGFWKTYNDGQFRFEKKYFFHPSITYPDKISMFLRSSFSDFNSYSFNQNKLCMTKENGAYFEFTKMDKPLIPIKKFDYQDSTRMDDLVNTYWKLSYFSGLGSFIPEYNYGMNFVIRQGERQVIITGRDGSKSINIRIGKWENYGNTKLEIEPFALTNNTFRTDEVTKYLIENLNNCGWTYCVRKGNRFVLYGRTGLYYFEQIDQPLLEIKEGDDNYLE